MFILPGTFFNKVNQLKIHVANSLIAFTLVLVLFDFGYLIFLIDLTPTFERKKLYLRVYLDKSINLGFFKIYVKEKKLARMYLSKYLSIRHTIDIRLTMAF